MRRRGAFARTIALDPKITLYDEPIAGQDPINKKILLNLIKSFNNSFNASSIIVSHDIKTALEISDYIYIISNGKIVCEGSPAHLISLKNDYAKQFINGDELGPLSFNYKLNSTLENIFKI
jgi:phospholipid/cholesterol/gamma-HCH transport system ATP-binding protein